MTSANTFERIETFLTLLFAVSVFVWKPGMYVSSGLITLYLLTRSSIDRDYGRRLWSSRLAQVSLAMFVLGIITASIGAEQLKDISWMARKTLFLPVIVFFAFALTNARNRTVAMAGLMGSFWVASLLTLHEHNWQLAFGGRMGGPWPIGTWDSLMGLFFGFMVLSFKWTGSSTLQRCVHVLTTIMALVMLLLAGGRAPWIGALISLGIYFVVFNRDKRVLISGLAAAIVVATLATTLFPDKARPVIDRFSSVLNTTTEGSNWVRLQLWEIGIAQLTHLAKEDPVEMLFGGGAESFDPKQAAFFKTMPFDEADRTRLREYGYPSGDSHNTYIDNALRHGVLWTIAMTLYLIWLCTRFSVAGIRDNPKPFVLLINLLIVGMFYTVVPHFVTLFFVLFAGLLQSAEPYGKNRLQT